MNRQFFQFLRCFSTILVKNVAFARMNRKNPRAIAAKRHGLFPVVPFVLEGGIGGQAVFFVYRETSLTTKAAAIRPTKVKNLGSNCFSSMPYITSTTYQ